ncbi:Hsp20 family protein [Aquibaculum arenosum]|uniref:Hsp20 family protein n=1 Tax=Aquibaculum arenosum TaxID=3032591 RepID=A0ABT5YQZ5_9PROT|nr:Hsp20 family protein [Fodinicurvata sp. CAU 1616]MDF2097393.1 Hsp20 family protein [Fodinicurvata sp. CAU 1616]
MRTFDLSPLLRATVGFERMMDMLDNPARFDEAPSYPPYNIEKHGEDDYRITMAVAGFSEEDLSITVQDNALTVEGKKERDQAKEGNYLHRGIAERAFQRSFRLADHIKVTGAKLENGLLHVDLVREVPEAMKPRTISIESAGSAGRTQVLENKAA